MPFADTPTMYADAMRRGYAIGGFIAYNMEMFQALVTAANAARSPVLLQSSAQAVDYAGGDYLVALARTAAAHAEVPVAHHLDHGFSVDVCKRAVDLGFGSVMIDASRHDFEQNIRETSEVVQYAHDHGVVVEGELGSPEVGGEHTVPERAAEFVERTGVDSLAVVIGNVHAQMELDRPPVLDLALLDRIHDAVPDTPLVLHALTTVPDEEYASFVAAGGQIPKPQTVSDDVYRAIAGHPGIAKLNNGASLKMAAVTAMRTALREHPENIDPRKVWGPARDSLTTIIQAHMSRLGSAGMATPA